MTRSQRRCSIVLLGFCFASGFSALMYEITWSRMLTLVFGNTTYAVSTVVTTFMAGLALGSFVLGVLADRKRLGLRSYACLEFGVAVFGFGLPILFHQIEAVYRWVHAEFHPSYSGFSAIRFAISFLVLLLPTTLMGGTLPVLARVYIRSKRDVRRGIGLLYGINTLGAVVGCVVAGFLTIGFLGVRESAWIAASVNMAIAGVAFAIGRFFGEEGLSFEESFSTASEEATTFQESRPAISLFVLMVALFLSGFAALSYEVLWTRGLIFYVRQCTYSFSLILAVYLVGLLIGSCLYAQMRSCESETGKLFLFAILQAGIGFCAIISISLLRHLRTISDFLASVLGIEQTSFLSSLPLYALLTCLVVLAPTILMGITFPLATDVCVQRLKRIGAPVGKVYGINTAGNILGSFVSGFILIGLVGLGMSLLACATVNLIAAGLIFLFLDNVSFRKRAATALVLISAIVFCWMAVDSKLVLRRYSKEKLVYYKETATGTIEVLHGKTIAGLGDTILVDGTPIASTGHRDLISHKIPAHLGALLHPNPRKVLLIAFGIGITSGTISLYDEIKRIDCVEICPGLIPLAREKYTAYNYNVLDDPRFHIIIGDGKNYVTLTNQRYDIVYSGPIHPQANPGSAGLYTRDFFLQCRRILNPGGMMIMWLPIHCPPQDFKRIVKTYQSVFPYTTIWLTHLSYDAIAHVHVIGSMKPIQVDIDRIRDHFAKKRIRDDILSLGEYSFLDRYLVASFLGLNEEAVADLTKGIRRLNEDDHPYVEYNLTRTMDVEQMLKDFARLYTGPRGHLRLPEKSCPAEKTLHEIRRYCSAARHLIRGHAYYFCGDRALSNIEYQDALKLVPGLKAVDFLLKMDRGREAFDGGDYETALTAYQRAAQLAPHRDEAHWYLAMTYGKLNRPEETLRELLEVKRLYPETPKLFVNIGNTYMRLGDFADAAEAYEKAVERNPGDSVAWFRLGDALTKVGKKAEACKAFRKAIALNPAYAAAREALRAIGKGND